MIKVGMIGVSAAGARQLLGLAAALAMSLLAAGFAAPARAVAADPAVVFMAQVGRELTAAPYAFAGRDRERYPENGDCPISPFTR